MDFYISWLFYDQTDTRYRTIVKWQNLDQDTTYCFFTLKNGPSRAGYGTRVVCCPLLVYCTKNYIYFSVKVCLQTLDYFSTQINPIIKNKNGHIFLEILCCKESFLFIFSLWLIFTNNLIVNMKLILHSTIYCTYGSKSLYWQKDKI